MFFCLLIFSTLFNGKPEFGKKTRNTFSLISLLGRKKELICYGNVGIVVVTSACRYTRLTPDSCDLTFTFTNKFVVNLDFSH